MIPQRFHEFQGHRQLLPATAITFDLELFGTPRIHAQSGPLE